MYYILVRFYFNSFWARLQVRLKLKLLKMTVDVNFCIAITFSAWWESKWPNFELKIIITNYREAPVNVLRKFRFSMKISKSNRRLVALFAYNLLKSCYWKKIFFSKFSRLSLWKMLLLVGSYCNFLKIFESKSNFSYKCF